MTVFQTDRLMISQFSLRDTSFIIGLTNTEGWLRNIGDRHTKTEAGAIAYLQNGPLKSYLSTGFGLWKISLKKTQAEIGICGCFQREGFEHPDIGYAFLPSYEGKGFATEAALASRDFVLANYPVKNIVAITEPGNLGSMRVLEKIGMAYRKDIIMPGESTPLKMFSLSPL